MVEMTAPPTRTGLFPNVPIEVYHGDMGSLSFSWAKKLLPPSCPAKFHAERTGDRGYIKHFNDGHAAHARVLGEGAEIVVIDAPDWRTAAARAERDKALAEGKIPLLPDEDEMTRAMAATVHNHPEAAALLAEGEAEQSLYWTDPETWTRLRTRPDWITKQRGRRVFVDYKGLALDTPIPTPMGWTTMGALAVGDEVFASDGSVCRVLDKSDIHLRDCYRVTFDDSTSIVCDDEHRWPTRSGTAPGTPSVLTAKEIARTLRGRNGQRQHRIPIAGVLNLPAVELPIDPYVLGVWLGDGAAAEGRVCKPDEELFDLIAARGYRVAPRPARTDKCPTRTVYGLRTQLRLAGLLGHKHVPDVYMRASIAQRLDLLRGLMDTDGSFNGARNQVVFVSVDKAQSMAVRELALSLGERAVLHHINGTGFGRAVTSWRVTWTPQRFNPFTLSRKAAGVTLTPSWKSQQRFIRSCEKTLTVPTQCIVVDSADHTYLCGEQMVPTHNTTKSAAPSIFRASAGDFGYHQQAAFNVAGAREVLDEDVRVVFIAQEKEPPYLVSVHEWSPEDIEIGAALNRLAIDIYAACTAEDYWPGYGDHIHQMRLTSKARYFAEELLR